jgi:hypothetical protein
VHREHSLGRRSELDVAEVLTGTFVGFHPKVQEAWAGFHCLDDHRGESPARVTDDHALTTLQMLGIMSTPGAITTAPYADAKLAAQLLPDVDAIPLRDAASAVVSLVWRRDIGNQLVEDLVGVAKSIAPPGDEL